MLCERLTKVFCSKVNKITDITDLELYYTSLIEFRELLKFIDKDSLNHLTEMFFAVGKRMGELRTHQSPIAVDHILDRAQDDFAKKLPIHL